MVDIKRDLLYGMVSRLQLLPNYTETLNEILSDAGWTGIGWKWEYPNIGTLNLMSDPYSELWLLKWDYEVPCVFITNQNAITELGQLFQKYVHTKEASYV